MMKNEDDTPSVVKLGCWTVRFYPTPYGSHGTIHVTLDKKEDYLPFHIYVDGEGHVYSSPTMIGSMPIERLLDKSTLGLKTINALKKSLHIKYVEEVIYAIGHDYILPDGSHLFDAKGVGRASIEWLNRRIDTLEF